jgi:hypothetical protein
VSEPGAKSTCMNLAVPSELPVPFEDLETADLVVDALYAGGPNGNAGDDPIARLIRGVGNQGGRSVQGLPPQEGSPPGGALLDWY